MISNNFELLGIFIFIVVFVVMVLMRVNQSLRCPKVYGGLLRNIRERVYHACRSFFSRQFLDYAA